MHFYKIKKEKVEQIDKTFTVIAESKEYMYIEHSLIQLSIKFLPIKLILENKTKFTSYDRE